MRFWHTLSSCVVILACSGASLGQTQITRWSFNGVVPSLNSDNGIGTSSVLGGLTQLFDGGSPNDAVANNQSMRLQQFSPAGASGTQGAQFNVPTTGFNTVSVTWDQRHSNSASRFTQFSYSIDGTNFITTGLPDAGVLSFSTGDSWALSRTVDLSGIAGVNNNPNFRFRLTAVVDSGTGQYVAAADGATFASSSTGGWRLDLVTVSGIAPQPTNPIVNPSSEPAAVCTSGGQFVISASVSPGLNPASTGLSVTANLANLGGTTLALLDNGVAPDAVAGDNIFSATASVGAQSAGLKSIPVTVTDAQLRTGNSSTSVTAVACGGSSAAQVVISQIYGGGSNLGPPIAPLNADYVELFNRSAQTVSLDGWSVQYAGPVAADGFNDPNDRVLLNGVIKPGQRVLVRFKDAGNTGSDIPTPDFSTPPGVGGLGNQGGRVALVRSQALIGTNCNEANIEDLAGYGLSAICFEGAAPAPTLANNTAAIRTGSGNTDTNQNFNDFTAGTPNPRNRSAGGFLAGYASSDVALLCPGAPITFTVNVTPGTGSTGIQVRASLSAIGGSATQTLNNTGGNTYAFTYNVPANVSAGFKTIPITVTDVQGQNDVSQLSVGVGNCTPSSAPVVISQFFAGQNSNGNAASAAFVADFVEIFNRTASPIDLTGWSLQYADGPALSTFNGSKQVNLSGTIGAGQYRLIQVGPSGTTGGLIPTPDFTATPPFGMDNQFGKIAIVSSTAPIASNCAAASVVDLVGYGSASSCFEGLAAAGNGDNTLVGLRGDNGCLDRNQSALDIALVLPLNFPRNSASPANTCVLPPATGACCVGTTCSIVTAAGCSGSFQGTGTACGPVGNPTTCCKANFDGVGGVNVQDIFQYLNAWFASSPSADLDGDGVNVQDIFAFLNAWFAGC